MSSVLGGMPNPLEVAAQQAHEAVAAYVDTAVGEIRQVGDYAVASQVELGTDEQIKRHKLIEGAQSTRARKVGEFCTATASLMQHPEMSTLVESTQAKARQLAVDSTDAVNNHEQNSQAQVSRKIEDNQAVISTRVADSRTVLSSKIDSNSLQSIKTNIQNELVRLQSLTGTQHVSLANLLSTRLISLGNLISTKDIALTNELARLKATLDSEQKRVAAQRASSPSKAQTTTTPSSDNSTVVRVPDSVWGRPRPKRRR